MQLFVFFRKFFAFFISHEKSKIQASFEVFFSSFKIAELATLSKNTNKKSKNIKRKTLKKNRNNSEEHKIEKKYKEKKE